jgi:hypothetical protein
MPPSSSLHATTSVLTPSCAHQCHTHAHRGGGSGMCKWIILYTAVLGSMTLLLFIGAYQQALMMFVGYPVFTPGDVLNISVTQLLAHNTCQKIETKRNESTFVATKYSTVVLPESRLPYFDQRVDSNDDDGDRSLPPLSREWKVLADNSCISTSHLDSNVCIRRQTNRRSGQQNYLHQDDNDNMNESAVVCLPSFMIVGFEKCSTTQLLLWLTYHPNLLGKWKETRFFSTISSQVGNESRNYDYHSQLCYE